MKNKKLVLCRVLTLTIVVSVLVSCFVITSSASIVPEASSDGYPVNLQEGYYLFKPDRHLIVPSIQLYEFEFYTGVDFGERFVSVSSIDSLGTGDYSDIYYAPSPTSEAVRACRIFEDNTPLFYVAEYQYLYIPAQPVNSHVLDFLGLFCVKAVDPGWYEFNYTSPLLGSSEFTFSLYPNSSGVASIPNVIYGRVEYNSVILNVRPKVPTFCIYFDSIDNDHLRFSTSGGFTSDLPGTTNWDGRLFFENPQFLPSSEQYYLFILLFTPSWYLDSPDADYDAGYSAGYDYGFNVGEASGLAEGFQQGKDTWYPIGLEEGENIGFEKGLNATGSENLGKNLLDSTLSAPWNALMNIRLFDLPGGDPFTFGTLVGTLLSLTLLIIFLKMFAGG